MSKRFFLFGEKAFEAHALDKFSQIANDIDRMCNVEVLMYRENFEDLLKKTVSAYSFKEVDISFENKIVDLIECRGLSGSRIYVEYSLHVTGDTYNLGLIPHNIAFSKMKLAVELQENVLAFEIDSRYHQEEMPAEVTATIKAEYEVIRKFIADALYNMSQTVRYYNGELEKFLIPLLANKLRKAECASKIREALNFK